MFASEQNVLNKLVKYDLSSDFQKPSNFGELENVFFDFASPPFQHILKGADFQLENIEKSSNVSSFEIVKEFTSRSRKVYCEKIPIPNCTNPPRMEKDQKMSSNARIQMAGEQFIDSYSSIVNKNCELSRPFLVSLSGLSEDEAKDVELLLTLLVSAEKTAQEQFDCASKLIDLCNKISSSEGNAVERLVHYFSEAIREKINRQIGKVAGEGPDTMNMADIHKALMNIDSSILAFYQKVPLSQVCEFSAMQTITEHVRGARKVHVIDLDIRTCMHYTVMMQALTSQCGWDIECLKITAIGTRLESKLKDTCNGLADFAKSMNIPFSFKIVMVTDILDFKKDLIELDDNEKVAIYSPYFLSSLIVKPNRLEHLMREIRKIKPCITVISEVEANLVGI